MATEKQIEANRLNAQKSTGPSTPEAKAKVRMNALRDGITGQIITLSEEEAPIFEQLKAALIADLAPKTTIELHLASSIAWDTWRLDRLRAVETNLYALGTQDPDCDVHCESPQLHAAMSGALTFVKHSKKMGLLSIYEQRLRRSLHKNMEKLAQLQAERKRLYEQDLREEVDIAKANEINGLPYQAPARRSKNGIVFSTAEILAAANRQSILRAARSTFGEPQRIFFEGAYENLDPNRPNSGPNSTNELAAAA